MSNDKTQANAPLAAEASDSTLIATAKATFAFSKNKEGTDFSGSIDCQAVVDALRINPTSLERLVASAFETEVNRARGENNWRELAEDGADPTDWLIDRLSGNTASGGRYKVTDADKANATAFLQAASKSDVGIKAWKSLYGDDAVMDLDAVAKHYMRKRAADDAVARAAKIAREKAALGGML